MVKSYTPPKDDVSITPDKNTTHPSSLPDTFLLPTDVFFPPTNSQLPTSVDLVVAHRSSNHALTSTQRGESPAHAMPWPLHTSHLTRLHHPSPIDILQEGLTCSKSRSTTRFHSWSCMRTLSTTVHHQSQSQPQPESQSAGIQTQPRDATRRHHHRVSNTGTGAPRAPSSGYYCVYPINHQSLWKAAWRTKNMSPVSISRHNLDSDLITITIMLYLYKSRR